MPLRLAIGLWSETVREVFVALGRLLFQLRSNDVAIRVHLMMFGAILLMVYSMYMHSVSLPWHLLYLTVRSPAPTALLHNPLKNNLKNYQQIQV